MPYLILVHFIQAFQSKASQCSGSLKTSHDSVSILAFDLFPWRQSRTKLAKTLKNGTNPLMSQMNTLEHVHTDLQKQT